MLDISTSNDIPRRYTTFEDLRRWEARHTLSMASDSGPNDSVQKLLQGLENIRKKMHDDETKGIAPLSISLSQNLKAGPGLMERSTRPNEPTNETALEAQRAVQKRQT